MVKICSRPLTPALLAKGEARWRAERHSNPEEQTSQSSPSAYIPSIYRLETSHPFLEPTIRFPAARTTEGRFQAELAGALKGLQIKINKLLDLLPLHIVRRFDASIDLPLSIKPVDLSPRDKPFVP
jgi:hypothetical protein